MADILWHLRLFVVYLIMFLHGLVLTYIESNPTVYFPELHSDTTPVCNNKTCPRLQCPRSDSAQEDRKHFCTFVCSEGTTYTCKDDPHAHGIIEFCASREICERGYMNKVYFADKYNMVATQRTACPIGWLQPWPGDCYYACEKRHVDLSTIEAYGLTVLSPGNSTHYAVGYCNVDKGFVNFNHIMYFNISLNGVDSVCYSVDKTKCKAEHRLLPDNTCSPRCKDGEERDRNNFFKCVKSTFQQSTRVGITSSAPKISTSTPDYSRTSAKGSPEPDTTFLYVAGIISAFAAVAAIVVAIVMCCKYYENMGRPGAYTFKTKKMKMGCRKFSFNTENGDVHVHIKSDDTNQSEEDLKNTAEIVFNNNRESDETEVLNPAQ